MENYKLWENPEIQRITNTDSRSYFNSYSSLENWKNGDSENTFSLNGKWQFMYLDAPEYSPEGFFEPDFESDKFNSIDVPSCWQLKGYGQMRYIDELYPFQVNPPLVPINNPTGIYKRKFNYKLKGNREILRFYGVDSAYHVYINGNEAGFAKISRVLTEFDITDLLIDGENDITVRVYQWSDGSYLEDQDMWWLSGLFRDVEILSQSENHVNDVYISTKLSDNYQKAEITAKIDFIGSVNDAVVSLYDQEKNKLLDLSYNESQNIYSVNLDNPKLWSAEAPNLYYIGVTIPKGEFVPVEFGIREIKIEGSNFLINGKAVMLKGINRHDVNCKSARTVSFDDMLWDIKTMKQHNINAVRTSHYPNHPYLIHLCNVYGLYVISEADLECHGFEDIGYWNWLANSNLWTKAFIERGMTMVKTFKNAPSVIMWSLGNESGFGSNFYKMGEAIRAYDSTRLIHYEGDFDAAISDVYSSMYPNTERIAQRACRNEEKPFILCEYCHAMGNGPGALKEHMDLMKKYKRFQGGFIWEWIDHGIETFDEKGNVFYKYGGDYGEWPNNGNFCMDGMVFPWREPSPSLLEYKKVISPVIISKGSAENKILVKNEYDFLSLSHLDLIWELLENGISIQKGNLGAFDIKSYEEKEIELPIKNFKAKANAEYRIHIKFITNTEFNWAAKGHLVAWEDLSYGASEIVHSTHIAKAPLTVNENGFETIIKGENFSVTFDKLFGKLTKIKKDGKDYLSEGITMDFWRADIDNDMYIKADRKKKYFMQLFESRPTEFKITNELDFVKVEILTRESPISQAYGFDVSWIYTINSDGIISLSLNGQKVNSHLNAPYELPRIGIKFAMPKEFNSVTWYGLGDGENYADSKTAAMVGRYTKSVQELHTPYPFPQENGNRGGIRWVSFDNSQNGLLVKSADKEYEFTAHDYTAKALDDAKHLNELVHCDRTIVNIDVMNTGVGSNSCGQGPLDCYKCKFDDFTMNIEFSVFDNNTERENEILRKY